MKRRIWRLVMRFESQNAQKRNAKILSSRRVNVVQNAVCIDTRSTITVNDEMKSSDWLLKRCILIG